MVPLSWRVRDQGTRQPRSRLHQRREREQPLWFGDISVPVKVRELGAAGVHGEGGQRSVDVQPTRWSSRFSQGVPSYDVLNLKNI